MWDWALNQPIMISTTVSGLNRQFSPWARIPFSLFIGVQDLSNIRENTHVVYCTVVYHETGH